MARGTLNLIEYNRYPEFNKDFCTSSDHVDRKLSGRGRPDRALLGTWGGECHVDNPLSALARCSMAGLLLHPPSVRIACTCNDN